MAAPAEPLLASALWSSHQATEAKEGAEHPKEHRTLPTHCVAIDTMLTGGFDCGSICCLSGDAESGTRQIAQSLIISYLQSSDEAAVVVIDTTFSLDVRKLHRALTGAMQDRQDAMEKAFKTLERLKIMKVFDFVGLTESLAELRDECEGNVPINELSALENNEPGGTIGDSEDEVEEEMLDIGLSSSTPTLKQSERPRECNTPPGLLVIDNVAQCVAPLLKNNYVQGQALLSSFMRSLSHLTKAYNLCTVLLNDVTPNLNAKVEAPSIFSSCSTRSALGQTFNYLLDSHLLVHKLPATTKGANDEATERLSIIEVLQDRHGRRFGKMGNVYARQYGAFKGCCLNENHLISELRISCHSFKAEIVA